MSISATFQTNQLDFKLLSNIRLENLTHLFLLGEDVFLFLNANFPNIKVIAITFGADYQENDFRGFSKISNDCLKSVQKLSINLFVVKEVLETLLNFPNLTELNLKLDEWDYIKNDIFISNINEILAMVPKLKYLGICTFGNQNLPIDELADQIARNGVTLRTYKNFNTFKLWIIEDWGQDGDEFMKFCEDY